MFKIKSGEDRRQTLKNAVSSALGILTLSCVLFSPNAVASARAFHMPQDTRLVTFNYNPNQSYTILCRPNSITDIQLAPGEKLEVFAMGNRVEWQAKAVPGNILIKPTVANAFTTGTMITNDRTYQLKFISSPAGGMWYQRVSWTMPNMLVFNDDDGSQFSNPSTENDSSGVANTNNSATFGPKPSVPVNDLSDLNFNYHISGSAPFRPTVVFNNHVFTWIKIPHQSSGIVPVFFIERDGKKNISNYSFNGDYLVVHQVFSKGILEADGYKVTITRR